MKLIKIFKAKNTNVYPPWVRFLPKNNMKVITLNSLNYQYSHISSNKKQKCDIISDCTVYSAVLTAPGKRKQEVIS